MIMAEPYPTYDELFEIVLMLKDYYPTTYEEITEMIE